MASYHSGSSTEQMSSCLFAAQGAFACGVVAPVAPIRFQLLDEPQPFDHGTSCDVRYGKLAVNPTPEPPACVSPYPFEQ